MELDLRISASFEEIESVFEFDDVLLIKYYERIGDNVYKVIARIPECDIKLPVGIVPLEKFRNEVIKACPEVFCVVADVKYKNGLSRRIYAPNEYWLREHSLRFGKRHNTVPSGYQLIKVDGRTVCPGEVSDACL